MVCVWSTRPQGGPVPPPSHAWERLAEKRNLALVVRMVVDQRNQLVHGELVDLDGTSHGRFTEWDNLIRLIRIWLDERNEDASSTRQSS